MRIERLQRERERERERGREIDGCGSVIAATDAAAAAADQ